MPRSSPKLREDAKAFLVGRVGDVEGGQLMGGSCQSAQRPGAKPWRGRDACSEQVLDPADAVTRRVRAPEALERDHELEPEHRVFLGGPVQRAA